MFEAVTRDTKVQEVIDNPVFEDYGRLLFPVDREIDEDLTLEDAGEFILMDLMISNKDFKINMHSIALIHSVRPC